MLIVMLLPVFIGLAAVAVDASRILVARQELQNAADAAALAGAAGLSKAGGDKPYNWTDAGQDARQFIGRNQAAGRSLSDGTVSAGYIRPGDPSMQLHAASESGWIQPRDVAAVRVSLSLAAGSNGGSLDLLLGGFLGSPWKDLRVTATAAAYPPGYAAAGAAFPLVIARCTYDLYWDYTARRPRLDPATGKPYVIRVGSVYANTCLSGEWTTFNTVLNDVPAVQALIAGGNPVPLRIGDMTYVQSGVKDSVYKSVPVNADVVVLVVDKVITGSNQPVVAMAAFHITGVEKIGGKSYISGNFTYGLKGAGLSAGSGGGQDLGAQLGMLSILVQ